MQGSNSGTQPANRQIETGITIRHGRHCRLREALACSCKPTYQALVWSARDQKTIRRTFPTVAKARAWRQTAQVDLRRGALRAPTAVLVRDEAEAWLVDARAGVARTRSGERYKPSALRSYEAALRRFVLPEFGHLRFSAVTRERIQAFIDRLVGEGLAPSTVGNAIAPLRILFRRAVDREVIAVNPTQRVALPKDRRRRDRVAEPREVQALLAVLPDAHRAIWTAAVYSGLRRGELQALGWDCVDLDDGILSVERSWDRVAGFVSPKSRSGERRVPIPTLLRHELLEHRLRQGLGGEELVCSLDGERPFDPPNTLRIVRRAWKAAGLRPIGFHECRHTYASLMIAAGVNAKALSTYMGHSSITVTLDRYGHLMPGNEAEAAGRLDRYLERETAVRTLHAVP